MKSHHDHSNSHKGNTLTGAGLQLRGLVQYHHGGKLGGRQADMCWIGSPGAGKVDMVLRRSPR